MKKTFLGFAACFVIMAGLAFKVAYEPKNSTAEVEQVQGVYIYVSSKPVKDYEFLGNVKVPGMVGSKDYEDLMPKMVGRALKEYPKADAVIFKGGSIYECDVIKFK